MFHDVIKTKNVKYVSNKMRGEKKKMLNLEKMWDSLTKENTGHGPTASQMFCQQFAVHSHHCMSLCLLHQPLQPYMPSF